MNKETAELIERIRRGDKDSFDILYREYSERLYKYIFRIVKNHHDAEDILEETFLKLIENIGELKYTFAFEIWVYKTARNTALHFLEKKDNSAAVKPDCELDDLRDIPDGFISLPEDYAVRKDIAAEVDAAVCALSDEQRETIRLKYYEDKTIAEIAEIMHVSEGTVKTRLSLAKKHLAKKLEKLKGNDSVFIFVPMGSLLSSAKRSVRVSKRPVFVLKLAGAAACAGIAVMGLGAFLNNDSEDNNNFGYYRYETSSVAEVGDNDSKVIEGVGVFHKLENVTVKPKSIPRGYICLLPEPDKTLPQYSDKYPAVLEIAVLDATGYTVDEDGDIWYYVERGVNKGWVKKENLTYASPDEDYLSISSDESEAPDEGSSEAPQQDAKPSEN